MNIARLPFCDATVSALRAAANEDLRDVVSTWTTGVGGDASRSPAATEGFGRVIGSSEVMRRLVPLLERLASTEIPVIIEGETGTGKELLAEAIHERGPRSAASA